MAKPKRQYHCDQCGAVTLQWAGQCDACGAWNSLQEAVVSRPEGKQRFHGLVAQTGVTRLKEISSGTEVRTPTGMGELDRVLGGGLVHGSAVLIGGDPGIGKSTLLLQTVAELSDQLRCLYVTGEESLKQVWLRAQRLGVKQRDLQLMTETCVERIVDIAGKENPQVMVIDSIQTMFTEALGSAPGSVAQVRESAAYLVRYAKQTGTALLIVGHVTKEGTLAGPRVLEHMVDTVLYFEGEDDGRYRVIRAVKNRFGAVNELGVFAMAEQGLKPVNNPSAIFLSRHEQPVPGSVIMVTREGTRPLLVEVQALVDDSPLSNPRRVTLGLEHNRLAMLLAVMHRHAGLALYAQDVFVNVVGGVRVTETAADLAVMLAALSSFRDRPLDRHMIAFGEIGLAGEIRPVPNGQERLQEAAKHGFQKAVIPHANRPKHKVGDIEVIAVQRIQEILDLC
jgi:DNA repair protein RadA/Sms